MKTKKLKKRISFAVSMALILCLALGGNFTINSYAAGDSVDPAVNCFATKKQLRTAFYPDQTTGNYVANSNYNFHTSTQMGRLSFGRKTWKIIGSRTRSTVVGIVSDSDIVLIDDGTWGSTAYNNTTNECTFGGKTVYANHYGVSKIREYLIERESDVNFFSITEQSYMNRTRHDIEDRKNGQGDIIEDIFYLPSYSSYHSKVFVGGIVVNISSYTSRNVWLMSSDEGAENSGMVNYWKAATVMDSNSYKDNISVNNTAPYLVAAFNLNVNDCIFASSAVSADSNNTIRSGIIGSPPCMELRLSASVAPENSAVKNATVGYDTLGNIYVTGASSPIILMVQGRNGTKDWYYSKYIASSTTTTKQLDTATIKNSIADIEDDSIDLSKCQIWLESVETDGDTISYATNPSDTASLNYIYAVGSVSPVSGLSNGVPKTSEGLSLPASVTITVIPASSPITSSPVIWDVASSSYDPSSTESQVFEVHGILAPPEGVIGSRNL